MATTSASPISSFRANARVPRYSTNKAVGFAGGDIDPETGNMRKASATQIAGVNVAPPGSTTPPTESAGGGTGGTDSISQFNATPAKVGAAGIAGTLLSGVASEGLKQGAKSLFGPSAPQPLDPNVDLSTTDIGGGIDGGGNAVAPGGPGPQGPDSPMEQDISTGASPAAFAGPTLSDPSNILSPSVSSNVGSPIPEGQSAATIDRLAQGNSQMDISGGLDNPAIDVPWGVNQAPFDISGGLDGVAAGGEAAGGAAAGGEAAGAAAGAAGSAFMYPFFFALNDYMDKGDSSGIGTPQGYQLTNDGRQTDQSELERWKAGMQQPQQEGCFITEAVMSSGGADNGMELEALRGFRDNTLAASPQGQALIAEYEAIAPIVVECVGQREDGMQIFQQIKSQFIDPAVAAVQAGNNEEALRIYAQMISFVTPLAAEAASGPYGSGDTADIDGLGDHAALVAHSPEAISGAIGGGGEWDPMAEGSGGWPQSNPSRMDGGMPPPPPDGGGMDPSGGMGEEMDYTTPMQPAMTPQQNPLAQTFAQPRRY